jgi:hypothetical protein
MNLLDLPNEILIAIFDNVDEKCFKPVTLTCKKFNEVAENSKLIGKMKIVADFKEGSRGFSSVSSTAILMESRRKFNGFCVRNFRNWHLVDLGVRERFWKFLEMRGMEYRQLEIQYCSVSVLNMQLLLHPLKRVQKMDIVGSYIQGPRDFELVDSFLFQGDLETLKIYNSDAAFLKLLGQSSNLQDLSIKLMNPIVKSNLIENFINQQKSLRILRLANISNCDLFSSPLVDPPKNLEELEIDQVNIGDKKKFRKFLRMQMDLWSFFFRIGSKCDPADFGGILGEVVMLSKLTNLNFSMDRSEAPLFGKLRRFR